ncbi:MAG: PH domain-containing protein [Pseudoclavibacter sp.]|nr:PH domain-containing protein [Pseudoclavibacter sp.]
MSSPVAPGAPAEAAEAWRRPSLRYALLLLAPNLLALVLCAAAVPLAATHSPVPWPVPLAAAGLFAVSGVLSWLQVRVMGFRMRDDDLLVRRGLFLRQELSAPYGRMQFVDVRRGPLARLLGLSELHLATAAVGTAVRLPGLPAAEAEQLRDRLSRLAESRRAGL